MNRAIILQTNQLTKFKKDILNKFNQDVINLANSLLKQRTSKRLMDLHKTTYLTSKKTTSFNSQVICDIQRNVVKSKGGRVKHLTVKFNCPRNCKIFNTKSNFFIELGLYPKKRLAVPIKQNRNYQRYKSLIDNGWTCKTYGLTSNNEIVSFLSKEDTELFNKPNMLGVDVNSKCFAVSIVSPTGKVLKQTYLGKNIWVKRKKIFERKSLLQSLADKGNQRAIKKLAQTKHKEANFVKNKIGEVVRDITNLALKYKADISIENLKRFSPKGKKFNKQVMRIPFYLFRKNLESRCFDKGLILNITDAYHTSKWCTHCGAVGKGHSSNYSLFKCKCGQVVNSDRKASLAIAIKPLLERTSHSNQSTFFQFSNRRVPVNGLYRQSEVGINGSVNLNYQPIESPPF